MTVADRCAWCGGGVHVELRDAVQLVDARWVHDACIEPLANEPGEDELTEQERTALMGWVEMMKRVRKQGIDGILTDEQQTELNEGLAEMAKKVHRG